MHRIDGAYSHPGLPRRDGRGPSDAATAGGDLPPRCGTAAGSSGARAGTPSQGSPTRIDWEAKDTTMRVNTPRSPGRTSSRWPSPRGPPTRRKAENARHRAPPQPRRGVAGSQYTVIGTDGVGPADRGRAVVGSRPGHRGDAGEDNYPNYVYPPGGDPGRSYLFRVPGLPRSRPRPLPSAWDLPGLIPTPRSNTGARIYA